MKKAITLFTVLALMWGLCACKNTADRWQEQYDLGVHYLSECNYEEAILAFTAAIEIDPKQVSAYVGRGNAYVLSGETEDNLLSAQMDYEKAIELDETNADAYLGLADVYIRSGDYDVALEILQQGLERTGNDQLVEKIQEFEGGIITDSTGEIRTVVNDNVAEGQPKYLEAIHVGTDEDLMGVLSGLSTHNKSNIAVILDEGDYEVTRSGGYIHDLMNVTIQGTQGTRLVSYSGYETVVELYECKGLVLKHLVIGHDLPPTQHSCQSGVLWFYHTDAILINCDIFGCGKYGIEARGSEIIARDTTIRDCSEDIMVLIKSNATFESCTFSGNGYKEPSNAAIWFNGGYMGLEPLVPCDFFTIAFSRCEFRDNDNPNLYKNSLDYMDNPPNNFSVAFNDCTFSGNAWK